MKSIQAYIKESMLAHIEIEAGIQNFIAEKHGSFDGIDEQCEAIANMIKVLFEAKHRRPFSGVIESGLVFSKDTANVFCKQIGIKVITNRRNEIQCAYIPQENDEVMFSDDKLYIINLSVSLPNSLPAYAGFDDITPLLTKQLRHELTHAYENFKRIKNGGISLFGIRKKDANYALPKDYENLVDLYNYFFNEQELNAHIAEFKSYLNKSDLHIDADASKIAHLLYNKIKHSLIYKCYEKLISGIASITDEQVEEFKQRRFKDMTSTQVRKRLLSQAEKIKRKLERVIPKIVCDYADVHIKGMSYSIPDKL